MLKATTASETIGLPGLAVVVLIVAAGLTYGLLDDPDEDGLANYQELMLGTDLLDWDTDGNGVGDGPQHVDSDRDGLAQYLDPNDNAADIDGDGFLDGEEARCLPTSDTTKKDIYVEIDRMEGVEPLTQEEKQRLVQMFEDAPVAGGGINLHLYSDDVVPAHVPLKEEEAGPGAERGTFEWYQSNHFDKEGEGYHYALLTIADVSEGFRPGEGGNGELFFPVMKEDDGELERFSGIEMVFAHELGHSIGLSTIDFRGIDSREVPAEEYPSVMNYNIAKNRSTEFLDYSNGSNSPNDFDDWGHLENNMYTPPTPHDLVDDDLEDFLEDVGILPLSGAGVEEIQGCEELAAGMS